MTPDFFATCIAVLAIHLAFAAPEEKDMTRATSALLAREQTQLQINTAEDRAMQILISLDGQGQANLHRDHFEQCVKVAFGVEKP